MRHWHRLSPSVWGREAWSRACDDSKEVTSPTSIVVVNFTQGFHHGRRMESPVGCTTTERVGHISSSARGSVKIYRVIVSISLYFWLCCLVIKLDMILSQLIYKKNVIAPFIFTYRPYIWDLYTRVNLTELHARGGIKVYMEREILKHLIFWLLIGWRMTRGGRE